MNGIKRNLLGETVSHQLRKAIIVGRYADGDHLAEPVLAKELGVSRGPVRDALQLLVREGFAERLPNGRVCARPFREHDIRNLFALRLVLESMSVVQWAESRSAFPHEQFTAIIGRMSDRTVADAEFSLWDMRFHRKLIELSGNKSLLQSWNGMEEVIKSIQEMTNRGVPRADVIIGDHLDIVNALARRDSASAIATIRAHLEVAERVMIAQLAELSAR